MMTQDSLTREVPAETHSSEPKPLGPPHDVIASQSYFVRAHTPRFQLNASGPMIGAFMLLMAVIASAIFIFQDALYETAQTQLMTYALACLAFTAVVFGLLVAFMRAYVRRNEPVAQSH